MNEKDEAKSVHGLAAAKELANILSAEILNEINGQILKTIYGLSPTKKTVCIIREITEDIL